jgi:hypothetical protein
MTDTININVEAEVPSRGKCSVMNCVFHGDYNYCNLFRLGLESSGNKNLITETDKCFACLAACQKACEPKPLPTRDFLVSCGSGGTVVLDGTGRIDE